GGRGRRGRSARYGSARRRSRRAAARASRRLRRISPSEAFRNSPPRLSFLLVAHEGGWSSELAAGLRRRQERLISSTGYTRPGMAADFAYRGEGVVTSRSDSRFAGFRDARVLITGGLGLIGSA